MAKRKTPIRHDPVVLLFAERLKEIRRARGMTQAELARQANFTVSYVSRLESALVAPGIDLVARLARALGANIADLLPTSPPADSLPVLKDQARRLFSSILETDDRGSLSLLNQFMSLVAEAASKNR